MSSAKAYPGSCHCGNVKYQIKLRFPPVPDPAAKSVRLYKCNCTTCHKRGYFHCQPVDSRTDFILTSPADPKELGEYRCNKKAAGWYFCKSCGVSVLASTGQWEEMECDVEKWTGNKQVEEQEKVEKVWKLYGEDTTRELLGKTVKRHFYLSVNAVTLEPSEDIDLIKWHDKGWLFYVENLKMLNGTQLRVKNPYEGGMY